MDRNDQYSGLGMSLSKDDGHTLTKVKVLYDYGRHHPSMVLMPKGEIVMTYVVRLGQLAKEYGGLRDEDGFGQWRIEAVVSRDNGESWDMTHRYVLAKWSGTSQAQSTSTVLLPDGSLLTAFGTGLRGNTGGLGYLGGGKSVPEDRQRQLGPLDIALVRWRPGPD